MFLSDENEVTSGQISVENVSTRVAENSLSKLFDIEDSNFSLTIDATEQEVVDQPREVKDIRFSMGTEGKESKNFPRNTNCLGDCSPTLPSVHIPVWGCRSVYVMCIYV